MVACGELKSAATRSKWPVARGSVFSIEYKLIFNAKILFIFWYHNYPRLLKDWLCWNKTVLEQLSEIWTGDDSG